MSSKIESGLNQPNQRLWVAKGGNIYGPYQSYSIKRFLGTQHLTHEDRVWNAKDENWQKFSELTVPIDSLKGVVAPNPWPQKVAVEGLKIETDKNNPNEAFPAYETILAGGGKKQFGTSAIYPIVCKDIRVDDHSFGWAVENLEIEEGTGIVCEAPDKKMKRGSLDRWLLKEPRALFKRDKDEINQEQSNKSPRISWIKWDSNIWKTPDGVSFNACRVGLLNTDNKTVQLFAKGMKVNAFGFISKMGAIVMVIKLEPGKSGISLGDAMELNYHIAHSGNHCDIPVLIPNAALDQTMKENKNGVCEVSDEKLSTFLKLWPHWEKKGKDEFDDVIRWGGKKDEKLIELKSFPELITRQVLTSLSKIYGKHIDTYQAARGRTHIYTRFLLPRELNLKHGTSLAHLEGLCARCMRHPKSSEIKPLPPQELEGDEFKFFQVTGSQRVYLSCETALSIGQDVTEFSKQWQDRWDNDYLLCHLIAYHQSILCQELSWSSFSKTNQKEEEKRNLDELNERFIEYCTHYDFSVISSQMNHQRTYRISREVLGVCQSSKEVAEEIQTRIEHQSNKLQFKLNSEQQKSLKEQQEFNHKQQAFNSLAVVFFMLGCSTFFINLNLFEFNNDARIDWDFSGDSLSEKLKSLWFWLPIALSFTLLLFRSVRKHVRQVFRLLFRSDK